MSMAESLAELGGNGFCKVNHNFTDYLQRHPDIRHNFLRFSSGGYRRGGVKYSSLKMFGKSQLVYYVLDCEEARKNFSSHLVKMLKEKNPNPNRYLRNAFTTLLHDNNLHSELCSEVLYGSSASVSSLQIFD